MINEIEIKILNIDPEEMERKLITLGAFKVKDEKQINMIFDTHDFYLDKSSNGYARIRVTEDMLNDRQQKTFTLKKNITTDGIRKNIEHNMELTDDENMLQILFGLGYELKHTGKKHRTSYEFEDILFEIDIWDNDTYPYPYMEIEVKREEDINRAIEMLEIDKGNVTTKSIQQLRKELELGNA
ncbi:MAG: Putative adenylate cyclase [Clostridiales bacterium 38_11]|nr:MAG: Putative adenylate cyclase [Clostridiales bacterium 38_11]